MKTCLNDSVRRTISGMAVAVICLSSVGIGWGSTVLFTTQEDWAQWVNSGSMTTTGVNTGSIDSSTTNGVGNTASPGGAGTNGSMQTVWGSGSYNFFFGPGEQGNQAFL